LPAVLRVAVAMAVLATALGCGGGERTAAPAPTSVPAAGTSPSTRTPAPSPRPTTTTFTTTTAVTTTAAPPTRPPRVTQTRTPARRSAAVRPAPSAARVTPAPIPAAPPPVRAGRVTAIGDSVMLGAVSALRASVPGIRVEASESRSFGVGASLVRAYLASGTLGSTVVVHLGSNGPFTAAQFDRMMQPLAGRRVLVLTVKEPRWWEARVNAAIRAGVARWRDRAVLLDWNALGNRHPEYFYSDGIHLRIAGARAYARMIAAAL
jgi:lysophospholipase L1-like esterase